jgi:hypothetical protein
MTRTMTAVELAPRLHMRPRTLLMKARNGEIGCIPGRPVQFTEKHVEDYLAAKERPAKPLRNPKYSR